MTKKPVLLDKNNMKWTSDINILLLKDCSSSKVSLVDSLRESLLADGIQGDFTTVTGGFSEMQVKYECVFSSLSAKQTVAL